MATADAPPSAPASWWATFALTDVRWLAHAFAWVLVLWFMWTYLPWLFMGFVAFAELGVLAALASAALLKELPALRPATITRYAVVDATFVAFSSPVVLAPLGLALSTAALMPLTGPRGYPGVAVAIFVIAFYATLGALGHARSKSLPSTIPLATAGFIVTLLAVQSYGPAVDHFARAVERREGVAAYERATGRAASAIDQLSIGNSRHGFDLRTGPMEIDAQGRILVAGGFSFYAGHEARGFVRLMPDGSLDPSFAKLLPGDPVHLAPTHMRILDDGSIYVRDYLGNLALLDKDGRKDPQFRPDIPANLLQAQPQGSWDASPDGALFMGLTAGRMSTPGERCVARIDRTGAADPAFESNAENAIAGPPSARPYPGHCMPYGITALPSGRWLVQGNLASTNFMPGYARLNADGTLDPTFNPPNLSAASRVEVAPDGSMLIVAYPPGGKAEQTWAQLRKVHADGTIDASFDVPANTIFRVEAMAMQPDGGVIVSGSSKPMSYGEIVRLTAAGRPDPAFGGPGAAPRLNGFANLIKVQPDGAILVGGEFGEVSHGGKAVTRNNILRLKADGTLDTGFDPR